MSQKTALERIEDLEKRQQQAEANAAGTYALAENCLQKLISLEQSYAALAKTLHALISTLKESELISDERVMENIRKLDDNQDRERVAEMREAGVIKGASQVHEGSLVIVKNIVIPKDNPKPVTLSDYRAIEVPSPATSAKLRQELVGKKIGDTIRVSTDALEALYTIIEIYELAEVSKVGENGADSQEKVNEQKAQEQAQ